MERVKEKPVAEMTAQEKGIAMASEALISVSRDEAERARLNTTNCGGRSEQGLCGKTGRLTAREVGNSPEDEKLGYRGGTNSWRYGSSSKTDRGLVMPFFLKFMMLRRAPFPAQGIEYERID
jgi:hypothetical protein